MQFELDTFTHILYGYFAGTGQSHALIHIILWSNPGNDYI